MSSLRERFTTEMKEAMKAGDKGKVSTVRLIQLGAEGQGHRGARPRQGPTHSEEILALLQKMIKQREESIAIYDANGRPELADSERDEVEIIAAFLPQQMGDAETRAAIEAAVAETGAASVKDMGKVIASWAPTTPARWISARRARW